MKGNKTLLAEKQHYELLCIQCNHQIEIVSPAVLTQTAVGQHYEGVCLAASPSFLAPGVDGDGSFRLLYVGDRESWVDLDTQVHADAEHR